jgi:pantoate--beta-alanine ligase
MAHLPVLSQPHELASLHHACVFVPTMGALHAGHGELIQNAARLAKKRELPGGCVVSIFVNPTQFNDPADFQRYPRTLDADLELARIYGASAVFAPAVETIYPPDAKLPNTPIPPVGTEPQLEDAHRPGHFAGVCQVVHRLFDLLKPAAAVFGEKDWQQLRVIAAMTQAANLPIQIIPAPTVRDHDGMAMSSRNRFLSPEDRRKGLALSRALCDSWSQPTPQLAEATLQHILTAAGITPDYAVVRNADTLLPSDQGPWRALIAAKVGPVRLIDNAEWRPA